MARGAGTHPTLQRIVSQFSPRIQEAHTNQTHTRSVPLPLTTRHLRMHSSLTSNYPIVNFKP